MSHRVPETRPVSRCPEPSRINVRISCAQYWRGHDPQRLYLAPSVPLCPALSSLTLQTLSCCFHPWHHAQRHHSSDWLSLQPVSLCIVDGKTPSTTPRFHWFEIWLLTSFPYMLETQVSGTSAENQHILPLCFSVLLPIVWLFFFMILWLFLCIFVSDQLLLVFFSKTSTVLQWKPLCLVGILFLWCNIHPSLIWLVGWNLWPLYPSGDKGKHW